ncbi:MAG: hypothetical protein ACRC41_11960 [Sarcina sp.]
MKIVRNEILSIIKYILAVILAVLIIYTFFLYRRLNVGTFPPKNSLEVSPLSGQSLMTINNDGTIFNVAYNGSNIFELYKIYDNEIVYEIFDKKTNTLSYKAATTNPIGSHKSITYLDSDNSDNFPTLSFNNYSKDKEFNLENSSADIFLEYDENNATSFIYTNGRYKYINSITQESEHNDTGYALTFSNIVIQLIDSENKNKGEGILFTAGKNQHFSFENNNFTFKESKKPLTLNKGNTIWIPLDKEDINKLVFN